MSEYRRTWLINNKASGSNDADALRACEGLCKRHGLAICHRTTFPQEELPNPEMLDAAEIDLVTIYAGDGTVNATLEALAGWQGAALILPGGTMNLVYHRLFGDAALAEAIAGAADGRARRFRPNVIDSRCGRAYAGLLAGPGTAWNEVREAMRSSAPLEMAAEARAALDETLHGECIRCEAPDLGRREGYPLLLLSPQGGDIVVDAYHAEQAGEYLRQAFALVRREFREGPHDQLGRAASLTLANVAGGPVSVLLDGEPCDSEGPLQFALARCEVDLLATRTDG